MVLTFKNNWCARVRQAFFKQVLWMYSVKPIKLNTQYHGLPAPYPPNLKGMYIIKKIWPPVNTISCYTCIYFKVFVTNNSYQMICLLTLNNFALRTTAVDQNDISWIIYYSLRNPFTLIKEVRYWHQNNYIHIIHRIDLFKFVCLSDVLQTKAWTRRWLPLMADAETLQL